MENQTKENRSPFIKVRDYIAKLFDLGEDIDKRGTIESVNKYIQIKGYNVWILLASAMLASIGLDRNAPAVIIGAMLISPLMSPILGIGLSIGINDRETLWLSIQNFIVAITVSILASYLYFMITPFGSMTSELLSRTEPTLLDVGVAVFGGIAGIVATSHPDQTNAIPGVAIATALMPPLCTVGFGLSIWNWDVWGGALYLFFINATIIAFTTYMFVRVLGFPFKEYQDPKEKRKTSFYIGVLVTLVIIPSIFILNGAIKDDTRKRIVDTYIKKLNTPNRDVSCQIQTFSDERALVRIKVVGDPIPKDSIATIKEDLTTYSQLIDDSIAVAQLDVSKNDFQLLRKEITDERMRDLDVLMQLQQERLAEVTELKNRIELIKGDSLPVDDINKELRAVFPEITSLGVARLNTFETREEAKEKQIPIFYMQWDSTLVDSVRLDFENRARDYLQARLECDTVAFVRL